MAKQYELIQRAADKPVNEQEGRVMIKVLLDTLAESSMLSYPAGISVIVPSYWIGNYSDCESLIQRYEAMGLEIICKEAQLPLPGSVTIDSVYCLTFKKKK